MSSILAALDVPPTLVTQDANSSFVIVENYFIQKCKFFLLRYITLLKFVQLLDDDSRCLTRNDKQKNTHQYAIVQKYVKLPRLLQ